MPNSSLRKTGQNHPEHTATSEQVILRGQEVSFTLVRSRRRSVSFAISAGELKVSAPTYVSLSEIRDLLYGKQNWILQKLMESKDTAEKLRQKEAENPLTDRQKEKLEARYREAAREVLTARVAYYHTLIEGDYTSISIRSQKTRWGSCSSAGALSFNWRLILAPPMILDYVVVHELCHLKHMNHSPEFWNAVADIMPDYKIRRKWLKAHSAELSASYEPLSYYSE